MPGLNGLRGQAWADELQAAEQRSNNLKTFQCLLVAHLLAGTAVIAIVSYLDMKNKLAAAHPIVQSAEAATTTADEQSKDKLPEGEDSVVQSPTATASSAKANAGSSWNPLGFLWTKQQPEASGTTAAQAPTPS